MDLAKPRPLPESVLGTTDTGTVVHVYSSEGARDMARVVKIRLQNGKYIIAKDRNWGVYDTEILLYCKAEFRYWANLGSLFL